MPRRSTNTGWLQTQLNTLGMTQKEFAREVDTDYRTVRRWISGETPVPGTVRALVDLCIRLQAAGHAWCSPEKMHERDYFGTGNVLR